LLAHGKNDADWVNSLSRGLQILECFSHTQFRLSQTEIWRLTNIPKATLFRLLRTLVKLNYLKYDSESKKHYLGPRVLSLGFSILQSLEVRDIVRPYLEELAREFNNSVNLVMLDGNEMVFIERIKVPSLRDFSIGIGHRIPVYNTAGGRAVLAYVTREKLRQVINQISKDTTVARYIGKNGEKLFKALNEVRNQGYAINDEQSSDGIRAIAVPIFSPEGIAYAVHMVVAPERVSVNELRAKYAPRLVAVGNEISEALGHQHEEGLGEAPGRALIHKGLGERATKNEGEEQRWQKVKKRGF
jgi:IclR family transcriptional regulator, pca regulon regulatory protein